MGDRHNLPELPQGWVLARLDNLFCWSSGKNLTQKKLVDGIYKVYGGNGITGKHNEWLCENESLVIGRVGAQCGNVHLAPGKSWITDNALYTSWTSHEVHLNYFFYLLSHLRLNEVCLNYQKDGCGLHLNSFHLVKTIH